jgi:hypothetical protein
LRSEDPGFGIVGLSVTRILRAGFI